MLKSLSLALALFAIVKAQIPAIATDVELEEVKAEYVNSGFESTTNPQGFGISLDSQLLVSVVYEGAGLISNGQAYTADQVNTRPTVYLTPSASTLASFTTAQHYVLILADASAVGGPDPEGDYRHYLQTGISAAPGASATGNATFALAARSGTVVTAYAGPGPLPDSGIHRYAWLVFEEGTNFTPPADISAAGTPSNHWSVNSYATTSNLGPLVGASFFTVAATGTPTFTPGTTSAIDTATFGTTSAVETGGPSTDLPSSTGTFDGGAASTVSASLAVTLFALFAFLA